MSYKGQCKNCLYYFPYYRKLFFGFDDLKLGECSLRDKVVGESQCCLNGKRKAKDVRVTLRRVNAAIDDVKALIKFYGEE